MKNEFRFLMISAMYENGGNTTHRFLDGHPQMFVYPFESQLGTNLVKDHLTTMFPVKYRWPVFDLDASPAADYKAIIDEECKVRARTPHVSKFRHAAFDFSDDTRREIYRKYIGETGRSCSNNVAAFFKATFDAWKDYKRSEQEVIYVGYSPIIVVDAEKIFNSLPDAHILHVVRNPWSAYADTKKRPVPLSIYNYMLGWTINQYHALVYKNRFPERMHIVRTEDVMEDPGKTLGAICAKLGVRPEESLGIPTWNSIELKEVYPWGTIRKASVQSNRETAEELTGEERKLISTYAWQYLDVFNYRDFIKT